jgi:hypothetical protein
VDNAPAKNHQALTGWSWVTSYAMASRAAKQQAAKKPDKLFIFLNMIIDAEDDRLW